MQIYLIIALMFLLVTLATERKEQQREETKKYLYNNPDHTQRYFISQKIISDMSSGLKFSEALEKYIDSNQATISTIEDIKSNVKTFS